MKSVVVLGFLLLTMPLFSIQTKEITKIIQAKAATRGDALYLTACLKDASLTRAQVKGSDSDMALDYGDLAKIILEQTGTRGNWLYEILHLPRYAFFSAVDKGWMSGEYSSNRRVSGLELVAVIGKVKQGGLK